MKKLICIIFFIIFSFNISFSANSANTKLLVNKEYTYTLLKYLKKAEKEVYISAFIWCCDPRKYRAYPCEILDTVIHLVKKGVNVTVILEKSLKSDSECNFIVSEIFKATLLKKYKNLKVYFDSPLTKSHEKVILIDGKYVFLGSHNLTQSALKYNNEVSILLESPEIYKKLKNYLQNIIKNSDRVY